MNYQKIYDSLVKKNHNFQHGEYFESHHIRPKSIGGKDTEDNLVNLTAREHYIAHALLVKIAEIGGDKQAYYKMLYAFNCMRWGRVSCDRSFKFNSRLYQKLKQRYSSIRRELMKKGITNPSFGKSWIHNKKLKQSKLWDMSVPIPDGWNIGRKITSWDSRLKPRKQPIKRLRTCRKQSSHKKRIKDKQQMILQKVELFTKMYNDYVQYGLQYVRDKYNYRKSQENLGMRFKRYVPNYDRKKLRNRALTIKTELHGRYNAKTKNMSVEQKKKYFTEVYSFFKEYGYDETIRHFQYNGTRNALMYNFRTYVDEYVPNNSKRWG